MGMRGANHFCIALILLLCSSAVFAGSSESTISLTTEQVRVLAGAYAHHYICVCASADQPIWRGDYWEIPITTSSVGHTSSLVRIDRRTGEVSSSGERSASIAEIEGWLKESRRRKK
jgi:hypothetical protein